MSIEVGLWRVDKELSKVEFSGIDHESRLEDILLQDISIIDSGLLLIGRQVPTAYGKFIDLLALDIEGHLVVMELKRGRTPREVVAQLLDYGSWVRELEDEDIASIYDHFVKHHQHCDSDISLDSAFCKKFSVKEMPESLNESHELVLVAGELDDSSERIIDYLSDEYGVFINAIFFRFFRDDDREYLSRAWLRDPSEIEEKTITKREKEPWNGEYYVSYGANSNRDWEEARRYGFISAGGGEWYSRTLKILQPGGRVWVNIPGLGYTGVGIVEDSAVPIDEFRVDDGQGHRTPILSLGLKASNHTTMAKNPSKAEYFVRIKWLESFATEDAIREKGFFGNQNSAAKPRAKRWLHTVNRLKQRFGIAD